MQGAALWTGAWLAGIILGLAGLWLFIVTSVWAWNTLEYVIPGAL
jgi:hypothetical protein